MSDETTKPNGSSKELEVQEVDPEVIKKMSEEYGFVFGSMDVAVTEQNFKIDNGVVGNATDSSSSRKSSSNIIVDKTMLAKFKNMIQHILAGITVPLRKEKEQKKAKKQTNVKNEDSKEK